MAGFDSPTPGWVSHHADTESNAIVSIETTSQKYELDIRKVGADEVKKMRKLLRKMNYDQKFQTSGI